MNCDCTIRTKDNKKKIIRNCESKIFYSKK